jgi:hypothetical protein
MKNLIPALLLSVITPLLSIASDTVELIPGKITGSISLSSEVLRQGNINAYATDGSGSASASFSGSTYSLTVPAGKTWKLNFTLYPEVPASSGTYAHISVNLPTQISVGSAEEVTNNISLSSTRVLADVQVTNGTLDVVSILRANASSSGSDWSNFNSYSQNLGYAVALPASNVSVYVSATVTNTEGNSSAQTLARQTVNVPASGATATWELDAAFSAGAIQGDINFTGAATPSRGSLQLYNSSYTNVGSQSYQGNGSYEFTNLLPGNYRLYNYAYFPGSQLYFNRNNTVAEEGVITQVDYVENLSVALLDLNPTGFLSLDNISSGYV